MGVEKQREGSVTAKFSVGGPVFVALDFFWARGGTGTVSIPPTEVTAISGPWDSGFYSAGKQRSVHQEQRTALGFHLGMRR